MRLAFFRAPGVFVLLLLLLAGLTLLALTSGNYPVTTGDILHWVGAHLGMGQISPGREQVLNTILLQIRLPRVMTAILVGMALASSGTAFQAAFRNPLVSPGLLGVLAGAAFGATLAMLLNGSWLMLQLMAFGFGVLAVLIGVGVGSMFGSVTMVMLVLGGIISGAMFSALLSIVKYMADPNDQLPSIIYWLMGNLGMVQLSEVLILAIPILLCVGILWGLGRALDILSMGDEEARSLGVPVNVVRFGVIAAATLASAISVSMTGMIGWIGLLAPHIARLLIGPGNRRLMPASALIGATFLIAADLVARTASQVEIPIGIVTECLGLPVFLLVIHRARKGWV